MIDNLRFYFDFVPTKNWKDKLSQKYNLDKRWNNSKNSGLVTNLYFQDNITFEEKEKSKSLRIEIKYSESRTRIIIQNSVRKWYLNNAINAELDKTTFEECLGLISDKLLLDDRDILFNAKVTRVELGINLKLRKDYRCFYTCIHSHSEIKKKCVYGNETIEFMGENKSVIFYDKIIEENKNNGGIFKVSNQKKLNDRLLYLRYEIKINKVSGVPYLTNRLNTLNGILQNWNNLADELTKELDKITFVSAMEPKVYDYLENSKIKSMNDYLIYLGMEHLGLEKWRQIMEDRMYNKIRSSLMKKHLKNYEDFREKIDEIKFETIFRNEVETSVKKLKI